MTWIKLVDMSALGHKRTYAVQKGMSALPPKADIDWKLSHVHFVPIADIALPLAIFAGQTGSK